MRWLTSRRRTISVSVTAPPTVGRLDGPRAQPTHDPQRTHVAYPRRPAYARAAPTDSVSQQRTPTELVSVPIANLPGHLYANMRIKHTGRRGQDTTQLQRVSFFPDVG